MIYDLIVVGSGSVGASTGYYAAKAGLKVLMIDNGTPPHEEGSHHGNSRLIRHAYGQGVKYVPMVLRAQEMWDELEKVAGERIMHRCGVINIGPKDCDFIQNAIESARRYELDVDILTTSDMKERWPQINIPDGHIGVFEPKAGYLKSEVAIRHWIRLSKEAGATQVFNSPVQGVCREGDFQKVNTMSGSFLGHKVLFSAGTWAIKLLPDLPVTPIRKVFGWYQVDDRYNEKNNFPGFVVISSDNTEHYGFPGNNNALKLGRMNGGQLINGPEERKPFGAFADDDSDLVDFLRQYFDGAGDLVYGKSCTFNSTEDHHFIIDTQPGDPNRLIITGLSGHGFKFATVLGEIAVAFAQNKSSPFDLSCFSLSRFNSSKNIPSTEL